MPALLRAVLAWWPKLLLERLPIQELLPTGRVPLRPLRNDGQAVLERRQPLPAAEQRLDRSRSTGPGLVEHWPEVTQDTPRVELA